MDIIDVVEYVNKMQYPEEFKQIKTCILVNYEMSEKAELWQNMNDVKDFPFKFKFKFEDAVDLLNE